MIAFKNVTKKFGTITALNEVSFSIERGEFTFITGPSGSGKTTIIRLILRDLRPTSGEVIFSGHNLAGIEKSQIPFFRRQIGCVFQDFKLLSDRTIGENIALTLAISGEEPEKQMAKARQALSYVGLAGRFNSFPSQLAGGELQRAVIARGIVHDPKLLLADEPTGNLDQDTAWEIVELMAKINKDGTTVLMATHNSEIVDKMKKHVIELKNGKVVRDKQEGKYKED